MSFLKKIGDTAKKTATTIGTKSGDMIETGKLKLKRNKLEGSIKEKKTEIGDLVYTAFALNETADEEEVLQKLNEIKELEVQIAEIDEELARDKE